MASTENGIESENEADNDARPKLNYEIPVINSIILSVTQKLLRKLLEKASLLSSMKSLFMRLPRKMSWQNPKHIEKLDERIKVKDGHQNKEDNDNGTLGYRVCLFVKDFPIDLNHDDDMC